MDCCGFSDDDEGYRAWNKNMYFNCSDDNKSAESCAVPWSCCVLKDVRRHINLKCDYRVCNGYLVYMVRLCHKKYFMILPCLVGGPTELALR